ncbi:hypothetical protein D3C71_1799320 [compost metagenome]
MCDIIDEVSLYTYLIDKGPIKITKYNYLTNKEIMFYYNKFNFIRLNLIYNGKLEMVPGHIGMFKKIDINEVRKTIYKTIDRT